MTFPTDFHQISDYRLARWPDNWFQNFGSYAFFHVVGLREYIFHHYGPISPSEVAKKLIAYKNEIFAADPNIVLPSGFIGKSFIALEYDGKFSSLVAPELLASIYRCSVQDIHHLDCIVKDKFYNLTLANIQNAYSGTCIRFSAALLVYLAAQLSAVKNGDSKNSIQIRFAGYHVPNFGAVFSEMELGQQLKLCAHVGDKLSQKNLKNELRVFSQMASGRPVTKPLADRTADFLNDLFGAEFTDFSAQPYELRTDIPQRTKKPAKGEKTFISFEGWAGP